MVLIGPQVSILILPSIFHNVATQLFSKGKNDYATSYFSFSRLPLALWRMTTNLNMANSPYTVWVSPFHCHHVSRSPTFFFIPSLFKLQDFFQFLECARFLWPWGFCTCSFLCLKYLLSSCFFFVLLTPIHKSHLKSLLASFENSCPPKWNKFYCTCICF